MRKILAAIIATALLFALTPGVAHAAASIDAFFGRWIGSGMSQSEISAKFQMSLRDLEVVVKAANGGGFEITWSTVQRQKGDPKNPTEVVKTSTMVLSPAGNGLWRARAGDPMADGLLAWARIEDNSLILSTFHVTQDGHGEYQIYRRTLSGSGMDLEFVRLLDGEPARTAKARLVKFSN